jgi:hypothetical protein
MASAACTNPATANGTTLFVVSHYDGGLGLTQLFFTGTLMGGSDVFKPSYRPEMAGATLPAPQSVRVLLASGFGGSPVTVEVTGFNADGTLAAYGSKDSTIVENTEVPVDVDLLPPVVSISPPSDGGTGVSDGGMPEPSCSDCTTSCCVHLPSGAPRCLSLENSDLRRFFCGKTGETCLGCDPLSADTCDETRGCLCGNGAACSDGQTCYQGHCVCSPATCQGCCTADGGCRDGTHDDQCGTGGLRCESCTTGAVGGTCNMGVCTTNKCAQLPSLTPKCLSGMGCADAGTFPYCDVSAVNMLTVACKACDYYTTNECTNAGCGCAGQDLEAACKDGQICAKNGCVTLPQELRTR